MAKNVTYKLQDRPDRTKYGEQAVTKWLQNNIGYYTKKITDLEVDHSGKTPLVDENLFWRVLIGVAVATVVIIAATLFLMPSIVKIVGVPFNPQWLVYLVLVVYLLSGFRTVNTNQVAGADFFGTPVHQFKAGLKWIPRFILRFQWETASFVQAQFPGDADHIDWGDEKEELEKDMVRPIRALFQEGNDPTLATQRQITAGIVFFAKWSLSETRLFDLIKNIGPIDSVNKEVLRKTTTGGANLTDAMYEVVRHLRDTGEAFVTELAGQMSFQEMTENLGLVSEVLKLRLQIEVMKWGINIEESRITAPNPGKKFNEGLRDRANALSLKDATITAAEGQRQKDILEGEGKATAMRTIADAEKARLTLEGEGRANAARTQLEALGDGYKAIAEKAGVDGEVVISSETAKKLAEAGNVVVLNGADGVAASLMGVVAASKKVEPK